MRRLKKDKSTKEKNSFEMLEDVSKSELYFIRGGDVKNTEKDDGDQ